MNFQMCRTKILSWTFSMSRGWASNIVKRRSNLTILNLTGLTLLGSVTGSSGL